MSKTDEAMVTRPSRLQLFVCAVAAAAALALLWYDAVLVGRVLNEKARNIGGDVVVIAYTVAWFCTVAAALLLSPFGDARLRRWRWLIASLCLGAAAGWLVLHGGGFIFSHESMFRNPCCSLLG